MRKHSILPADSFETHFKDSFDVFFDGLHRYAVSILKDREKASDAVQLVFLKWWENQKQLNGLDEAKVYLFTAVYRTCLNELRNDKVRLSNSESYLRGVEVSTNPSSDLLEFEELDDHLRSSINGLPPQRRIIFCKSRFEAKTYAEIADEMNLSPKTIEVQMGKALKFLREALRIYFLSPN